MDKIAIFDLGGVLVDVDTSVYNQFNIFSGCKDEEIMNRFGLYRWEIGFISDGYAVSRIAQDCNLSRAEVVDIMKSSITSYNHKMADFIKSLPYFRFALTNITPMHWEIMKESVEPLFLYVYKSFELRMRKPEVSIYHAVRSQINDQFNIDAEPESIYFVDDREENVDAARALGWNALRFDGDMEKIREFFRVF